MLKTLPSRAPEDIKNDPALRAQLVDQQTKKLVLGNAVAARLHHARFAGVMGFHDAHHGQHGFQMSMQKLLANLTIYVFGDFYLSIFMEPLLGQPGIDN